MPPPISPKQARPLPAKWIVLLLALAVGYVFLQPVANRQFGWQLPSLGSLLQEANSPQSDLSDEREAEDSLPPESPQQAPDRKVERTTADPTETTRTKATPAEATAADEELLHGILRDIGREQYLSPAGLKYGRGSEEGHRLKHLERHLADMPDRPGKHGVFEGGFPEALAIIDDAYARGKKGSSGVTKRTEDRRTVCEASFDRRIGYVGGREGNQKGKPTAKKLRLVVEGDRFITAFPF